MKMQRPWAVAVAALVLAVAWHSSVASAAALFPQADNNAGLERPVTSTSECGSPPESYCGYTSGACLTCNATCPFGPSSAASSQQCGCPASHPFSVGPAACCQSEDGSAGNCVSRINADAHPPFLAVDTSAQTYFQSALNQQLVNLTLDLLIPHEITIITATFMERVPYAFAILKSIDGETWEPLQVRVCVCVCV